jgi:predicted ribosome quality control (RQC) complex YloA/Tae2 family protein
MEESLQKTIDKFKSFAQSLREFRDNLVLGKSSTLTPLQKYLESEKQFNEISAKALKGDEQAQSKFQGAAQAFLEASSLYNASSPAYTRDYNSVLEKVNLGITSAEASVSVAELQLGVANTQVDLLTSINTNIAILAGVPQMARGGLGRGLTLVGEVGPELVDFNQPGRVYTADQTAGMFAPRANVSNNMFAVVAELRQVKQEIAQLRKEQQQQTGDLIVSNYDANQRNAKEVAQAVEEVNTATQWASRNEVTIV